MKKIRIGSGAGYSEDRLEPAIDVMKNGNIDYVIFECLAERTIALAQQAKLEDPLKGYNNWLEYRMDSILPLCAEKGFKVITNMGAANPLEAAELVKKMAIEKGLSHLRIIAVIGDDIFPSIDKYVNYEVLETGELLSSYTSTLISANAYIGAEGILKALQNEADIVITGRVADPSLALGALMYEFDWSFDDYEYLGRGTLIGHLLECGAQVTGGYFADPGYKDVPELWNVGFPIVEVDKEGEFFITKLKKSGGIVSEATVKEQILYEIHDPANYFTPDVIADFSKVEVKEFEGNSVSVTGATGKPPTGLFKTSIGYKDSFIIEGEMSYGGLGSYKRAKLAGEIVNKRITLLGMPHLEIRTDYIGVESLYKDVTGDTPIVNEVRLRIAARTEEYEDALRIGKEIESLYTNGPAGGGGYRMNIKDVIGINSIFVPSKDITIQIK